MANAKAEAVKVYQFRKTIKGAFLADLENYFSRNRTDFQPRWRYPVETAWERKAQKTDFLKFGRRMLEVATLQASMANRDVEHDLEGWAKAAHAARKAGTELRKFLNSAVGPSPQGPLKNTTKAPSAVASQKATDAEQNHAFASVLEISWLQMLAAQVEGNADLDAMKQQAKSKVRLLLDAMAELDNFAQFTGARYRQLKAARKRTGHPQKVRFTVEMMRGWVFLFGRRPKYEDKNFAHFLSIAWGDICENTSNDERWDYAIKLANKELKPELARLAQNGPHWD